MGAYPGAGQHYDHPGGVYVDGVRSIDGRRFPYPKSAQGAPGPGDQGQDPQQQWDRPYGDPRLYREMESFHRYQQHLSMMYGGMIQPPPGFGGYPRLPNPGFFHQYVIWYPLLHPNLHILRCRMINVLKKR